MFRQAAVIIIGSMYWVMPARADINLEFRPPGQTVLIGDTVNVGLYAVSDDDETDQLLMSAQVIISWDPDFLQLLGNDTTGAVPLLSSGFPPDDPYNLNEVVPPQDGDGLYVAFAPLGNPVAATPAGILLTTFQFLALDRTLQTTVEILELGGDPEGRTIVFDGTVPNFDVTGTLTGGVVEVVAGSCFADINPNGQVGPGDLALLLGAWGPCPQPCTPGVPTDACPADLDPDCDVGPFDLALLLGAWGPCQP